MRHLLALAVLLVPVVAVAQVPPPDVALRDALDATAQVVAVSAESRDPRLADAAQRARRALADAVAALRAQPLCRPPPVLDPMTFALWIEELQRGNRTSTLPLSLVAPTVERHLLSVAQLKRLLELMPRSTERLQLVQLANRRILDPESAAELYEFFPLKQDQRALAQVLAQ